MCKHNQIQTNVDDSVFYTEPWVQILDLLCSGHRPGLNLVIFFNSKRVVKMVTVLQIGCQNEVTGVCVSIHCQTQNRPVPDIQRMQFLCSGSTAVVQERYGLHLFMQFFLFVVIVVVLNISNQDRQRVHVQEDTASNIFHVLHKGPPDKILWQVIYK